MWNVHKVHQCSRLLPDELGVCVLYLEQFQTTWFVCSLLQVLSHVLMPDLWFPFVGLYPFVYLCSVVGAMFLYYYTLKLFYAPIYLTIFTPFLQSNFQCLFLDFKKEYRFGKYLLLENTRLYFLILKMELLGFRNRFILSFSSIFKGVDSLEFEKVTFT